MIRMASTYLIRWGNRLGETHNRGAEIIWQPNQTVYRNPQQSPGQTIHTWKSRGTFETTNYVAALPLLSPDQEYEFDLRMQQKPAESVNLVISYYDRDNQLIGQNYFAELTGKFTYPENAANYQFELINLNNQELIFTELWLHSTVITTAEVLLNSRNRLIKMTRTDTFNWTVTLVAESLVTTTLPVVPDQNNLWVLIDDSLKEEDITAIQKQLINSANVTIKTFGAKIFLQDAKVALEKQLTNK